MNITEQIAFLEELLETDQKPREDYFAAKTEEEKQTARIAMIEQDEKNLAAFLEYAKKHEWPRHSIHGEKPCDAAWLIIQHSSIELMEKYYPVLKSRAEENEASKVHAAMMEDRMLMWQGKPQKYGSQGQYRENKGLYMWPVEIPEKVNQLRKEAGFLTTIEEKAKEMDAIYDPELKLENF